MRFWNYLENKMFSGWCNTVIADLMQRKGLVSMYINSYMNIFGNDCLQKHCSAFYFDKINSSADLDIFLIICYRDVDEVDLVKRLNAFASQYNGSEKNLFIFEPSPSFQNTNRDDVLVYSIENGNVQKI